MQKAFQAPQEKSSFFKSSFFGLVKFSTKFFWRTKVLHQGMTGRGLSTEQAARDTRDGERKGRGGKWTPLG